MGFEEKTDGTMKRGEGKLERGGAAIQISAQRCTNEGILAVVTKGPGE